MEEKADETTTAVCCSSDYSLDGAYCKRSVPTVLAVPIEYDKSDGDYHILTNSTTTLYSATIAVYTVHALFQEEDKALLGLTDEVDISIQKHHHGLSLGAQIGIGIGVTAAVVLLLGGAMFLLARRRLRPHAGSYPRRPGEEDVAAGEMGQPPPVYRSPSAEANSHPAHSKAVSESSATTADTRAPVAEPRKEEAGLSGELMALRSQQADLQRRIDELEKTTGDGRG
jgi:hypothetical protein